MHDVQWKVVFSEHGLQGLPFVSSRRGQTNLPGKPDENVCTAHFRLDSKSDSADPRVKQLKSKIAARLSGKDSQLQWADLDLSGWPAFYLKIWKAMHAIPFGRVATYAEIARAAGSPLAFRACGQACAANPVLLFIPCHRVISATGIGGFSCGLEWKKIFLEKEGIDWRTCKKRRY